MHRAALEQIEPGRWLAWALDVLGCAASGSSWGEAADALPGAIHRHWGWRRAHGDQSASEPLGSQAEVGEMHMGSYSPRDNTYWVNAFFEDDRRLLSPPELLLTQKLLAWARVDLRAAAARPVSPAVADQTLRHIAIAENWYFERLNLGLGQSLTPADRAGDPLALCERVRDHSLRQLSKLSGSPAITQHLDETWSPRKVVRRMLWHEREHTAALGAPG